ncbi:MAG: ABC transporter ATP-binding protein [Armatimonadota bacterium]|nr:ABC transporter ATP-binding protein [Armatimonadota bacterium]MDR5704094.1 ABC transporter ATP-binding protein [Armatimonadota bacterium]MDR7433894.1 ABC transporter ATP-binding protein [Armatimonadota bacterium]
MLSVTGLVVGYGDSIVVQGLSLHVSEGEIVALLGRNGAGKTTTLRGLIGLTPPRSGHVWFRGKDLRGLPPYQIARFGIAYVPDDRRIFPHLTVEENLLLAARVLNRRGPWTLERVYQIFPSLSLLRRNLGTNLSGGEQKMLAIGRALMTNPLLLLLDEPAEGLAPLVVQQLIRTIEEIRAAGVTILLADQNMHFCRRLADRGYVIDKGSARFEGTMEEIWRNEEVIRQYLSV